MTDLLVNESGIKLQVLKGQKNYVRWSRDFKLIAQLKGVWNIISGEEPILLRPQKQDYFNAMKPTKKRGTDDTIMSDGIKSTISNEVTDNSSRIAEYKIDLEEYERNNKRVRTAAALLQYWVDSAVRETIQAYLDPKDAWKYIQSQYKMQDARSLDIALTSMEKITLENCASVQEYLNQHEMCRLDIKDVGGEYTDAQLMSKLIRGLTHNYNAFVDQYHLLHDVDGLRPPNLKGLASRLLTFESKLRERNVGKPNIVNHVQGDSRDRRNRDKCTVEGCGKWGHKPEKCWVLHPELKKPKETGDSATENARPRKVTTMTVVNRSTLKALLNDKDKREEDQQEPSTKHPETSTKCEDHYDAGANKALIEQHPPKFGRESLRSRTVDMLVENDSVTSNNSWILDSGANVHLINRLEWFTTFKPITYSVGTADSDGKLNIKGEETISLLMLSANDQGEPIELVLITVAYALDLRYNVMSLSMLTEAAELHEIWNRRGITIHTSDEIPVDMATLNDELYRVEVDISKVPNRKDDTSSEPPKKVATIVIDFSDPVWVWHRRMGHLEIEGLRKLLKMSNGMTLTDKQIKGKIEAICPICATTKSMVKIPRDPASRRFNESDQLIHVNIWGPYPVTGWEKTKYFLIFVDDATRFVWHRRLATRADMPEEFRNLHKTIERERNIIIRRYRTKTMNSTTKHWFIGSQNTISAENSLHPINIIRSK